MPNHHLVILKRPYLEMILAGRKTIESRFYMTKRGPLGRVHPGDTLFLKVSSGPVCAKASVEKVRFFDSLTPEQIRQIKGKYNGDICGADEFWQSKADCRFGLLAWLRDVRPIKPVRINKKDWRAWVVLTETENFGLLDSF